MKIDNADHAFNVSLTDRRKYLIYYKIFNILLQRYLHCGRWDIVDCVVQLKPRLKVSHRSSISGYVGLCDRGSIDPLILPASSPG